MTQWKRRSVLATGIAVATTGIASSVSGAVQATDDDENGAAGTVERPEDTRVTADQTGPSGVQIAVDEDLTGLELTISEETTGADTAEIADELGQPLETEDISGLGPGDTFQIEYELEGGEEYIVLLYADETYDRGSFNEDPEWPYDGDSFQVVEGIYARDRSSTSDFYAYKTITALTADNGDNGNDNGDDEETVERPEDTRITTDQTGPSGVRIAVDEDLSGLELTISEQTTGADTAEIADDVGETLTTEDISELGPGDTFQIEYDFNAEEEYIVLLYADGTYDRGSYDQEPDWPYDGGSFQVVEGIYARDRSSTSNFYAYTTITALMDDNGDNGDDNGDDEETVERPEDTRATPDTTTPSGVRIAVDEDLTGLELTISEQTTGADTAEIADESGEALTTEDISELGPEDSFQIEYALEAGEEYIVLLYADGTYTRGSFNEDPEWPYDGDSFQVVEGVYARDRGVTSDFYAYTTVTALR